MQSYWIAPSILNADQQNLFEEIEAVSGAADLLHLDIMDNIFVPNQTYSLEAAKELINNCKLPVDAHLMIVNPEEWAPKFASLGCYSTTFHYEAASDVEYCIREISKTGSKVGIALKPNTELSAVLPYLEMIDMVLIMTVEPGFGGQKYIAEMESKIRQLRREITDRPLAKIRLEVDGGINLSTIAQAAAAGADTFVAGSAIYAQESKAEAVNQLRRAIAIR
jgi:ribulose-phosphate 3-epimerase